MDSHQLIRVCFSQKKSHQSLWFLYLSFMKQPLKNAEDHNSKNQFINDQALEFEQNHLEIALFSQYLTHLLKLPRLWVACLLNFMINQLSLFLFELNSKATPSYFIGVKVIRFQDFIKAFLHIVTLFSKTQSILFKYHSFLIKILCTHI